MDLPPRGLLASGWTYVGIGGFLIATKETWELVEGNHWHTWEFWVLLPLGVVVSIGHAVGRTSGDERGRAKRRDPAAVSEPVV